MIKLSSLSRFQIGQVPLDLASFDCGRKSINEFFQNEAQAYQDELFGKTYFFVSPDEPTKMKYRNWNTEKDGPLETRLMFRDMILLRRNSIRQ